MEHRCYHRHHHHRQPSTKCYPLFPFVLAIMQNVGRVIRLSLLLLLLFLLFRYFLIVLLQSSCKTCNTRHTVFGTHHTNPGTYTHIYPQKHGCIEQQIQEQQPEEVSSCALNIPLRKDESTRYIHVHAVTASHPFPFVTQTEELVKRPCASASS